MIRTASELGRRNIHVSKTCNQFSQGSYCDAGTSLILVLTSVELTMKKMRIRRLKIHGKAIVSNRAGLIPPTL